MANKNRILHPSRSSLALVAALVLTGCATAPGTLDQKFGQSVRAAVSAQTAHPGAGRSGGPLTQSDGVSAIHVIERHRQLHREPPGPTSALAGGAGTNQ